MLDVEPIRLIVQGTAGVGKTFVIIAITYITRRLFGYNSSVMNLAPTGAAAILLPGGRTVHSVINVPRSSKKNPVNSLTDKPLSRQALAKLRDLTGTYPSPKLMCLN